MATTGSGPNMRVRISADLQDIKQGLGLLRGELAKVKAEAARTAPDTGAWAKGIGNVREQLGNLVGAYVGVQTITGGIRSLFAALDRADRIGELAAQSGVATEDLSRLAYGAQFSGVQIESLSDSIVKLNRGLLGNEPLLKKIGIATRDAEGNFRSANEIITDLSDVFQALPDGPEKAALAVKLFGKSGADIIPFLNEGSAKLREYGEEAERTGNVIDDAATKAAGEFSDNLDRLKGTLIGVANETVRSLAPALNEYAAEAFSAGENSNFAAEGGKFLSTVLKVLAASAIVVKNLIEGVVNVLGFLGTIATSVSGTLTRHLVRSFGLVVNAGAALLSGKNPITVFSDLVKGGRAAIRAGIGDVRNMGTEIAAGFSAMKDGIAESGSDIASVGKLFDDAAAKAKQGTDEIKGSADKASPATQKLLETLRALLGGDGKDKPKAAKDIDKIAASTALLQDQVKRAQEALDQQFEDKKIGIAEYYAKRVELEQRLIDLQIEQLQSELAITKELAARRRLEEQLIILQRDRGQIGAKAAREQAKAEADLNKEKLAALGDRSSELTGGLSAQESAISAQMEAGTLGYVEGERRLQEVRATTLAQLQQLRADQAAYIASLNPGDPNMAAAQQGLLNIDTALANVTASMQQMKQGAMDAGVGALRTFFQDLRDDIGSVGQAFRDLVTNFISGLAEMAEQALAKKIVGAIAGMFGNGDESASASAEQGVAQGATKLATAAATTTIAGTILTTASTMLGSSADRLLAAANALLVANAAGSFGAAHGGGIAGSLRMYRNNISPLVFGAAPRYHGGGVAGLASDEIPAILKRGEVVRTQQQERALAAQMDAARGAGGNGQPARVIVVFSEDELANALSGAAGERVTVAHVRNNRTAIDND